MNKKRISGFVRKYLKDVLTLFGHKKLWTQHGYSEDGEDGVLRAFYETRPDYRGFYVDIGAYHPIHLSNTQWFYEQGWHGINIDATPGSMKTFNKIRKRDVNIETGVSDTSGEMEFLFFGPTSTINKFGAKAHETDGPEGPGEKINVPVQPINELLDKHVPKGQHIDFITMDVEGFELKILQSLDFANYAPDFFLIEDLEFVNRDFMEYLTSPLYALLKSKGYLVVAKTQRTVIFRAGERIDN
ncbi:MAG: FkbM family methyltransferase [Dysgonamonadaceae bacterium]|jgi:FkbM family methyltransferase|nr:FkbM family methyltransferase [Dysgonamonadaceae bacterium]